MPTSVFSPAQTAAAPTNGTVRLGLPSSGLRRSRPWQIGLGAAVLVVCAATTAMLFAGSSHRTSVLVAAANLPAGTVLTAADVGSGSLPTSSGISSVPAAGEQALVGRQLAVPLVRGQMLLRSMIASAPVLAHGSSAVGLLLKADQMPTVPVVAGDRVDVIAVTTPSATSASSPGTLLLSSAPVLASGPAPLSDTQDAGSISIAVPRQDVTEVAGYAAADQIAIALIPGTAR